MKAINLFVVFMTAFFLVACGGGSGGSSTVTPPPSSVLPNSTPMPTSGSNSGGTVADVVLSGKITFDNVPHDSQNFGLDYASTTQMPARGIMVSLLTVSYTHLTLPTTPYV